MPSTVDQFGNTTVLSPGKTTPLISPNMTSSEKMPVALTLLSAQSLLASSKGITSHPMCEVSLVLQDDMLRSLVRSSAFDTGSSSSSKNMRKFSHSFVEGHKPNETPRTFKTIKTVRTAIVKGSLNPIWNLKADFGMVDPKQIAGVVFVIKHVEKFGVIKKDLGQVFLSLQDLREMYTSNHSELSFNLEPTVTMALQDSNEGISGRKYGLLTIRLEANGNAIARSGNVQPACEASPQFSPTTDSSTHSHEDAFTSDRSTGKHDVLNELRQLKACHQNRPTPGDTWYAIAAPWITEWLLFVSHHKGDECFNPGPIPNMQLVSDELIDGTLQLRHDLVIKKDFRVINKSSWELYSKLYGGGPAIKIQIPTDCPDTYKWIYHIKLHEMGKISSAYLFTGI